MTNGNVVRDLLMAGIALFASADSSPTRTAMIRSALAAMLGLVVAWPFIAFFARQWRTHRAKAPA